MARRTALELSQALRDAIASQNEDDYARLLEDINDSVSDVDISQYVAREEYDRAIADREAFERKAKEYRDKYINRFYEPGKAPDDQTYIMGAENQETIEKDEKEINYDNLWE